MINGHTIASPADWLQARTELLAREKAFTKARDELSQARRALPWERVEKNYAFEGPDGRESLADLFAGKSQLIVYHFMFAPEWEAGCKSCSFWADNFNGVAEHLRQRDTQLVAISRAPLEKLAAFKKRMGWDFKWVSSGDTDFNYDYGVSIRQAGPTKAKAVYNYAPLETSMTDLPGFSVFYKDEAGAIFHTYSCYARGLDMMNGAYHLLDLTPKGRDEDQLPFTMSWLKLHDLYEG
jgi:predicted dithiol-disulfide oxidoreductase (DUF899 family)